ncbi:hypothetical protein BDQ17DRAFT_1325209 [Cyathus striatus]|nr:hypothetical protein BDQ17DRAFT_1325209 [Cyathus striatus]
MQVSDDKDVGDNESSEEEKAEVQAASKLSTKGTRSRRKKVDLEEAMDDLINTHTCNIPCQKMPIEAMFGGCEINDRKLQQELEYWHKNKTIEVFGCSILVDMGPSLAMPSEVLDHIAECVHLKVIKNVNQLICETCWADAEEYVVVESVVILHDCRSAFRPHIIQEPQLLYAHPQAQA